MHSDQNVDGVLGIQEIGLRRTPRPVRQWIDMEGSAYEMKGENPDSKNYADLLRVRQPSLPLQPWYNIEPLDLSSSDDD